MYGGGAIDAPDFHSTIRPYGREHASSGNKLSLVFFDKRFVAHCTVDDRSTEFPKKSSTENLSPQLPRQSSSRGHLHRESASAGRQNGTCCVAIASYRTFPPVGPIQTAASRKPLKRSRNTPCTW